METRLLRMFCVIAEHGSLVTAAARLHLTPSALSHGIRSLEAQVGCRLFDRAGKKLLLNQAGEQFLRSIGPPLAALDQAAEQLKHLSKWGQGRLRVGATASVCQHLLPKVIRELKKLHDRIEIQVQSASAPELIRLVQEAKVDVAITVTLEEPSGVSVRQLFRDELMLVFAPTHPWAKSAPISAEELRKQPLILFPKSSTTRRLLENHFERLEITPSTIMEIDNAEAIKELVKLNLGVSVLAPWTVDKELARRSLVMRPLGNRALTRNWVMLFLSTHKLSLPEETFCRICRQQASSMRLDRRDVAGTHK
jgi:LysR family transcriptional regulator, low CO2-responsive transcriptional regulator